MHSQLKTHVQNLLKIYEKLLSANFESFRLVGSRFYLECVPKVFALKMSTVRAIQSRRIPYIYVVEPQSYNRVSKFTAASEDIENLYMSDPGGLAVTGSGGDRWIHVTPVFASWLAKLITRMKVFLRRSLI